jgi:hypothetical protein
MKKHTQPKHQPAAAAPAPARLKFQYLYKPRETCAGNPYCQAFGLVYEADPSGKDKDRLLGAVIRKEVLGYSIEDLHFRWQYQCLGETAPRIESRRGPADLWRLIHLHHGLPAPVRRTTRRKHPRDQESNDRRLRVAGDWTVDIRTVPGSGIIGVEVLPGFQAMFDPEPGHWRPAGEHAEGLNLLDQLGPENRQRLEEGMKKFACARRAAFRKANGG